MQIEKSPACHVLQHAELLLFLFSALQLSNRWQTQILHKWVSRHTHVFLMELLCIGVSTEHSPLRGTRLPGLHQNHWEEGRALRCASCECLRERPHLPQEVTQLTMMFQHHKPSLSSYLKKRKQTDDRQITSSGLWEAGRSPPGVHREEQQCGDREENHFCGGWGNGVEGWLLLWW